jgi:large subunit ribosomal protein L25
MTTLQVEKRDTKEDVKALRANGIVPAVFYGPKQDSTSIKLKAVDFIKAYREAGESTIITLEDGSSKYDVLVQDLLLDPVKGSVVHVDFYAVEKGKKVEVSVPLVFVGEAAAENVLGGTLVKVMHEVDIEALPNALPHEIEVSIESLVDFEAQIHAKDLILPEGVSLITEPDEDVALVQEHKEEAEDIVTPDLDSIEVQSEKKKDEE